MQVGHAASFGSWPPLQQYTAGKVCMFGMIVLDLLQGLWRQVCGISHFCFPYAVVFGGLICAAQLRIFTGTHSTCAPQSNCLSRDSCKCYQLWTGKVVYLSLPRPARAFSTLHGDCRGQGRKGKSCLRDGVCIPRLSLSRTGPEGSERAMGPQCRNTNGKIDRQTSDPRVSGMLRCVRRPKRTRRRAHDRVP